MREGNVRVTIGIPTYNRAKWLHESIASVLSQTYENFRLLICDNASDDETREVVESITDPRIHYVRSDRNLGMIRNYNRVIQLAETDSLVLLSDDDVLYPEYLSSVIDVLDSFPSVGVVHTAFDLISPDSCVLEKDKSLLGAEALVTVEPGDQYLERSMHSSWTVCFPSALFRRNAILRAGGLRADEEPFADVPLLMRIALEWDYAFVSKPLVGFRLHGDSATADLGSFTGTGYELDDHAEILFERRTQFLDEARLSAMQAKSYSSIAKSTFRREAVESLANQAGLAAPWTSTNTGLLRLLRKDAGILLLPTTWRLVAGQLGARYVRRALRRRPRL